MGKCKHLHGIPIFKFFSRVKSPDVSLEEWTIVPLSHHLGTSSPVWGPPLCHTTFRRRRLWKLHYFTWGLSRWQTNDKLTIGRFYRSSVIGFSFLGYFTNRLGYILPAVLPKNANTANMIQTGYLSGHDTAQMLTIIIIIIIIIILFRSYIST